MHFRCYTADPQNTHRPDYHPARKSYLASFTTSYLSQGQVKDVTLRRMAREEMADNVEMFELFTQVHFRPTCCSVALPPTCTCTCW